MEKGSIRVLVVDDSFSNVELLDTILVSQGYGVFKAHNGEDGLRLAQEVSPHIVLLDVMIPGMNGYEVCKQLKEREETRFTPVVMLTSLNSLEDKVKGLEAGADDFITKPFQRPELLARVKSLLRVRELTSELEKAQNILITLALTIEFNDPYTHGHSQRVSEMSVRLARFMGLSEKEVVWLRDAGLLHDIGKIGMDKWILHKPGNLDGEEYEHIKQHPVIGERICSPLIFAKPLLPVIRNHHERFNGGGYPDGLKGDDIPFGARLTGIVDAYDALMSLRPYRSEMSQEIALEVMKVEAGKGYWDPEILSAFLEMLKEGSG
ncbi:MAG: response regulator [Deltaproteobacteria bacterium]|nr:response regulator [Deltaproteobacteria bacterium]